MLARNRLGASRSPSSSSARSTTASARSVEPGAHATPARSRFAPCPQGAGRRHSSSTRARAQPAAPALRGTAASRASGARSAQELVLGGETPLWDVARPTLVGSSRAAHAPRRRRRRRAHRPARSAERRRASSSGSTRARRPPACPPSASRRPTPAARRSPVFRAAGLSTVDDVDTPVGRLALALLLAGAPPGQYGVKDADGVAAPLQPGRPRVAEPLAVLVAARDEAARIGPTVEALRSGVSGGGGRRRRRRLRDGTAEAAEAAGARVLRLPRRGKGQALTARRARRAAGGAAARRRRPRRRPRAAARTERRPRGRRVRGAAGRRLRDRQARRTGADPHAQRLRGARAALRPARALARRARGRASRSRRGSAARCG